MKVLVTGGAGFIGSHLVDGLIKSGHSVRSLDNLEPQVHEGQQPDYLNPAAEYLWGDVRDRKILSSALKGIEVVFHQAAKVGVGQSMYEIESYTGANVMGAAVLLDAIVNEKLPIQKMIVASSMSIYGEGGYHCSACGPVFPSLRSDQQLQSGDWEVRCPSCNQGVDSKLTSEEKPLAPTSVYAVSKRDQEELFLSVGRSYQIPTVALRYFNVYGPRQSLSNPYTGACAIFSSRIKNGNAPIIYEDGKQSRDFIHVSDIVQANLLALEKSEANNQAFNVGTGVPNSILSITQMLIELYQSDVKPQLTKKFRAGDIRHCSADISRLQALGFAPKISLPEGLKQLSDWGRQVKAQDRVDAAAQELEERGLTQG